MYPLSLNFVTRIATITIAISTTIIIAIIIAIITIIITILVNFIIYNYLNVSIIRWSEEARIKAARRGGDAR